MAHISQSQRWQAFENFRKGLLGLWQPDQTFEYAIAQGGFKGESYQGERTQIYTKRLSGILG